MLFLSGPGRPWPRRCAATRTTTAASAMRSSPICAARRASRLRRSTRLEMLHEAGCRAPSMARAPAGGSPRSPPMTAGSRPALPGLRALPALAVVGPGARLDAHARARGCHARRGLHRRRVARPSHRVVLARDRRRGDAQRLLAEVRVRLPRRRPRRGPCPRRARVVAPPDRPGEVGSRPAASRARRCVRSTSHPARTAGAASSSPRPRSRRTSTPLKRVSSRTAAGCSTGSRGRRRRPPTGAGP